MSDDEPLISRKSVTPKRAPMGEEQTRFLAEVAVVLGCDAEKIDLAASLQDDYGCDELDVSECVQIAEEIWGVQLAPNPMSAADYSDLTRRFDCLNAIIAEADRRAIGRA